MWLIQSLNGIGYGGLEQAAPFAVRSTPDFRNNSK